MVDKSYGHSVRAVYQGKVVSPDHAAVNDAIIRNVEVSAQDGIITIKGCAKGDAISIYTINGVIVDQQEADGTSIRIHVATDQMYIVKAAGKVVKILM
jgi:hypothetical protein